MSSTGSPPDTPLTPSPTPSLRLLEIVGAVAADQCIEAAAIEQVLNADAHALEHGGRFTGRPGTRIYCDGHYVVKLRSELKFSALDTRRWVERTLVRERELAIHHPRKTWCILDEAREEGASERVIASATPLLSPLHLVYGQRGAEATLAAIARMLDMYMRVASTFELRLDEGLSNFALDEAGALWYLDDETYQWDRFESLAQSVGVYLRQLDWLTPDLASRLGEHLVAAILRHFPDRHWLLVFAELVRGLFFARGAQAERAAALVATIKDSYRVKPKAHAEARVEAKGGSAPLQGPEPSAAAVQMPQPHADCTGLLATDDTPMAILADVHANLPALRVVLDELKALGVERGLVLGDVVGYGPHPGECIDALAHSGFHVVLGNHDHGAVAESVGRGFSANARWVLDWTRERLSEQQRVWLAHLPPFLHCGDWLAVHGAPRDKTFFNGYVYRMTYEDNLQNLEERQIPLCFHGHSHVQGVYYRDRQGDAFTAEAEIGLGEYTHSLACPGSVGQPRGGVAGAEFAVYYPQARRLRLYRLGYDIDAVTKDMARHGFPTPLLDRLYHGR